MPFGRSNRSNPQIGLDNQVNDWRHDHHIGSILGKPASFQPKQTRKEVEGMHTTDMAVQMAKIQEIKDRVAFVGPREITPKRSPRG